MKIRRFARRLSKKVLELVLTWTFVCGVYVGLIGVSKLALVNDVGSVMDWWPVQGVL